MEEITKNCDNFQRFSTEPLRFEESLSEEPQLVFQDEILLDLPFIDGRAIFYIVDTATHFSAATFLYSHGEIYGQTVEGISLAFVMTCVTLYVEYPNQLRTEKRSVFTSDRWRKLGKINGIELCHSGVKVQSSLGIRERYHESLRRIY